MAVTAIVKQSQYRYKTDIEMINSETIKNAKDIFNDFLTRGIILDSAFDDVLWRITDEAETCSIKFDINEVYFERNCRKRLGCTQIQYEIAMRVLITALFGSGIRTLQKTANSLRKMLEVVAGENQIETLQDSAGVLVDFLELLPGNTLYREDFYDLLSDMVEYGQKSQTVDSKPRNLASYQSYFKFYGLLESYWKQQASLEEKLFYFPIYLWWMLTSILPLRPSEFVLIPRDCLIRGAGGVKLTIRRTKLKGHKLKAEYFIDKDYELFIYDITENLADEIETYIQGTEMLYGSDISTLFCSQYHYKHIDLVKSNNSKHYTYNNLRDCLRYFYNDILCDRKGIRIKDKETGIVHNELADDEIEWITLGDTRHLSMINLIISGGNPVICKELANHEDIAISANYYSNIRSFVEVLSFSRFKQNNPDYSVSNLPSIFAKKDMPELINGGRCASEKLQLGDYSDCMTAISLSGNLLDCDSCKYYVLPRNKPRIGVKPVINAVDEREKDLKKSFNFLVYAIESVRKGLGYHESIQSALLRIKASALQYGNSFSRKYGVGNYE